MFPTPSLKSSGLPIYNTLGQIGPRDKKIASFLKEDRSREKTPHNLISDLGAQNF